MEKGKTWNSLDLTVDVSGVSDSTLQRSLSLLERRKMEIVDEMQRRIWRAEAETIRLALTLRSAS